MKTKPHVQINDSTCVDNFPKFFSTQITSGDYFHFGNSQKSNTQLEIICGGLESCNKGYKVDRSDFKYYGIEYIVSGSCRLSLQGQEFELNSGSVFCYGPTLGHKIENIGDGSLIKYFIDFTGTEAPDLLWESFLKEAKPTKLNNIKWISDIFQQILDCGKIDVKSGKHLTRSLLEYLIHRIETEKSTSHPVSSPSHTTYDKTRAYIEENYLNIKRVSEVAQACHLSLPHLCRLFKRYSNEAPTQVLIRLKLEKAVELISSGNYLIKEVADYVGFEDPFYFSHRFKQHFGVSPSNYAASINQSPHEEVLKAS